MLAAAWADFQANLWLYLSMPVTCGLVGYATNVLAIKMMFHPLDAIGKPPLLGWQGIVPSKAGKMASIACDTLVPQLVTEREIFERLDPERIAEELEQPMVQLVDQLMDEIMREYQPALWESLPLRVRDLIIKRVQADAPAVIAEVMEDIKDNIDRVFDLKDMVVTTLVRDKSLINKIFLETGKDEFTFIGRSGFYFGFLFGIVQMVGWTFYKADFQLPAFGLLVGYLTNFIALKMIFQPQDERRIGPWRVQGLFHKRQKEVAADYGRLIADEIVTPSNILEGVLKGPYSDRVFNMIARNVSRTIDEQSGVARPFVAWTVGTRNYIAMKDAAIQRLVEQLPRLVEFADDYAAEAMDLQTVLSTRLSALPPAEFEAMLRPAFQEDEWMLIAVGAALGFMVGVGQLFLFTLLATSPVAVTALLASGLIA